MSGRLLPILNRAVRSVALRSYAGPDSLTKFPAIQRFGTVLLEKYGWLKYTLPASWGG